MSVTLDSQVGLEAPVKLEPRVTVVPSEHRDPSVSEENWDSPAFQVKPVRLETPVVLASVVHKDSVDCRVPPDHRETAVRQDPLDAKVQRAARDRPANQDQKVVSVCKDR